MTYTEKNSMKGNSSTFQATTPLFELHDGNLKETIEEFLMFANPSDFQQVNCDLLNYFVFSEMDKEESEYSSEYLQSVLFMVNMQNVFLSKLKETFENLKKLQTT